MRCITFSISDVLVTLASPRSKVYKAPLQDALHHYRLPCPPELTLRESFRAANARLSAELPHFGGAHDVSEREWWRRMIRATLADADPRCWRETDGEGDGDERFELVFQRAYSSFGARGAWAAGDGAAAALRAADDAGLIIGAVDALYHRYADNNLPALGLHTALDFVLVSHEAGVAAPDPRFFARAARRAGAAWQLRRGGGGGEAACAAGGGGVATAALAPAEMLHVSRSLDSDFLAAKRFGMHALLLDPRGTAEHDELSAEEVVRSLDEVPARLAALMQRRRDKDAAGEFE